jgi:hypothetical protein
MSKSRVLTGMFVGLLVVVSFAEAQTAPRLENERSQAAAQGKAGPEIANYRAQVVVTDRVDDKVVASDTFHSVFTGSAKLSRSRGAGASAKGTANESSAFEISVASGRAAAIMAGLPMSDAASQSQFAANDMIRLTATAQLRLLPTVGGPGDIGADIAQNVEATIKLGKPYTMVDMVTDRAGRRRVTVQITITRVPVE